MSSSPFSASPGDICPKDVVPTPLPGHRGHLLQVLHLWTLPKLPRRPSSAGLCSTLEPGIFGSACGAVVPWVSRHPAGHILQAPRHPVVLLRVGIEQEEGRLSQRPFPKTLSSPPKTNFGFFCKKTVHKSRNVLKTPRALYPAPAALPSQQPVQVHYEMRNFTDDITNTFGHTDPPKVVLEVSGYKFGTTITGNVQNECFTFRVTQKLSFSATVRMS